MKEKDFKVLKALIITNLIFIALVIFFSNITIVKEPENYIYTDITGKTGTAYYCGEDSYSMYCKSGIRIIHVREYHLKEQ